MSERKKIEKIEKFVTNLLDKEQYFILTRNLKQALNHGLVFKKVQRVIKFNQKSLPEIMPWYEQRAMKNAKNDFEKDFFELINDAVFWKSMENLRKHRDIKLLAT